MSAIKIKDDQSSSQFKHQIIQAIRMSFETEWFKELAQPTKRFYFKALKPFEEWLNQTSLEAGAEYDVLNLYHEYRVNILKLKPKSSGSLTIGNLINKLLSEKNGLNKSLKDMCSLIAQRHRKIPKGKTHQISLSDFFTKITWLKEGVSEDDYLILGKPKLLCESFIIIIATLLFEITTIRNSLSSTINKIKKDTKSNQHASPYQKYKKRLLFATRLFKEVIAKEELKDESIRFLFLIDCVNSKLQTESIESIWTNLQLNPREKICLIRKFNKLRFNKPNILHSNKDGFPSDMEQNLFSFICAWLTVPAQDIYKLKRNNFLISSDENGQPQLIKCSYFKGRSGVRQLPNLISAESIVGKAMLLYLAQYQEDDSLFSIGENALVNFTFGRGSTPLLLAKFFEHVYFREKIAHQLKLAGNASDIFLRTYLYIFHNYDISYTHWNNARKNLNLPYDDINLYKEDVKKWLPSCFLRLSAIKNSSIHSRSDKFRKNDPINSNSHKSATEYNHYLTDSNKEWVNLNGFVTRSVLNKVEGLFKYDINRHNSMVSERLSITKFEDLGVDTTNIDIDPKQLLNIDNLLKKQIVLDTAETVIFMLHYIQEVISKAQTLVNRNLEFFEFTALPTAEWMETILATKISPKILKIGKERYQNLQALLPDLFMNEIAAGDIN